MIHKDTSIAESGMMNPSPFLRHKGTLLRYNGHVTNISFEGFLRNLKATVLITVCLRKGTSKVWMA